VRLRTPARGVLLAALSVLPRECPCSGTRGAAGQAAKTPPSPSAPRALRLSQTWQEQDTIVPHRPAEAVSSLSRRRMSNTECRMRGEAQRALECGTHAVATNRRLVETGPYSHPRASLECATRLPWGGQSGHRIGRWPQRVRGLISQLRNSDINPVASPLASGGSMQGLSGERRGPLPDPRPYCNRGRVDTTSALQACRIFLSAKMSMLRHR